MASMAMVETPTRVTDEALAAQARAGNRSAFTELVERHRDTAYAYAMARLTNRDEAEDIAQEAFVRAFMAIDRFRLDGCWGAWLMRIVRNLTNDALRKRLTRQHRPLDMDWVDDSPTPEAQVLRSMGSEQLARAVNELPEKFRTPLVMHYGSRRTYKEIALALGLPESTIIGRMAGAMRILRKQFAEKPV